MTMIAAVMTGLLLQAAMPAHTAPAPMAPMPGMDRAAAPCPATPAPPPPELAGWMRRVPVVAGGKAAHAAMLTVGTGAEAKLLPTPGIAYPVIPGKPGAPDSYGGLFAFTVAVPGRYRIATRAGVWIDVVRDGAGIASVAHGHGPECSGIRKTVDFDLKPGRHLLQIAGSTAPTLSLIVVRLP